MKKKASNVQFQTIPEEDEEQLETGNTFIENNNKYGSIDNSSAAKFGNK